MPIPSLLHLPGSISVGKWEERNLEHFMQSMHRSRAFPQNTFSIPASQQSNLNILLLPKIMTPLSSGPLHWSCCMKSHLLPQISSQFCLTGELVFSKLNPTAVEGALVLHLSSIWITFLHSCFLFYMIKSPLTGTCSNHILRPSASLSL